MLSLSALPFQVLISHRQLLIQFEFFQQSSELFLLLGRSLISPSHRHSNGQIIKHGDLEQLGPARIKKLLKLLNDLLPAETLITAVITQSKALTFLAWQGVKLIPV